MPDQQHEEQGNTNEDQRDTHGIPSCELATPSDAAARPFGKLALRKSSQPQNKRDHNDAGPHGVG